MIMLRLPNVVFVVRVFRETFAWYNKTRTRDAAANNDHKEWRWPVALGTLKISIIIIKKKKKNGPSRPGKQ